MYEMLLFLVKSSLLQCPALYAHPGSDMQNTWRQVELVPQAQVLKN